MQNIKVNRYANPRRVGWAGNIEPEDRSWIAFIGLDGRPLFFLNRDPATGAILPDDPSEWEAHRQNLVEVGGLRIGMKTEEGDGRHEAGEIIHPLGIDGTGGRGVEDP
jgi:hypothetical protein